MTNDKFAVQFQLFTDAVFGYIRTLYEDINPLVICFYRSSFLYH